MSKYGCGHAFFTEIDRKNRTLYTLLYAVKASVYKGCGDGVHFTDEPTGALDSHSAQVLMETFLELNVSMKATIFMVTHDAFCASYCGRILFLKDGKIFNELVRGTKERKTFLQEILDVLSLTGGERYGK